MDERPPAALAALVPSLAALDPLLAATPPSAPPRPHDALVPPIRSRRRRNAGAAPSSTAPRSAEPNYAAESTLTPCVASHAAADATPGGTAASHADAGLLDHAAANDTTGQHGLETDNDNNEINNDDDTYDAPLAAPNPSVTPVSSAEFVAIVHEVDQAIAAGVLPVRIAQGSSGSYFCKDRSGRIVAIFKPKDEEPYSRQNPKWAKWLQRNFAPCCFGRACITPGQGFLSEAAASFLDRRLALGIVPRTEVVRLASPSFFYPFLVRWTHTLLGTPLPPKIGSFQLFLSGYRDATTFFREGQERVRRLAVASAASAARATTPSTTRSINGSSGSPPSILGSPAQLASSATNHRSSPIISSISILSLQLPISLSFSRQTDLQQTASLTSTSGHANGVSDSDQAKPDQQSDRPPHPLGWSLAQERQFRAGFEHLVVLDYLIRNTDRGSDNWMVKWPRPEEPQLPLQQRHQKRRSDSEPRESSPFLFVPRSLARPAPISRRGSLLRRDNGSVNTHENRTHISESAPAQIHSSYGAINRSQDHGSIPDGLNVTQNAAMAGDTPDSATQKRSNDASGVVNIQLPVMPTLSNDTLVSDHVGVPALSQLLLSPSSTATAKQQLGQNESSSQPSQMQAPARTASPEAGIDAAIAHDAGESRIYIGAIDNGLAFPTHHPDRIRSYPYGWSFLPIAHVPFTPETACRVLPALTSTSWWHDTLEGLETLFRLDPDFKPRLWRGQRAVIRGQAYNLVEELGKVLVGLGDEDDLNGGNDALVDTNAANIRASATPWNLVHRPPVLVHEELVDDEDDNDEEAYDGAYSDGGEDHLPYRGGLDFGEQLAASRAIPRVPSSTSIRSSVSTSALPLLGGDGDDSDNSDDDDDDDVESDDRRNRPHAPRGRTASLPSLPDLTQLNHNHHRRHASHSRNRRQCTPPTASMHIPSFMRRQQRKLRRVRRRLVTFVTRRPCFTYW